MSIFIDTSVWFAAANSRDRDNRQAKSILAELSGEAVMSDYILVETWGLLNSRVHREAAERFWLNIRRGAATIEKVTPADMETAWAIGEIFPDQKFSLVDRTSFAVMERLAVTRVASFDNDFAVYRYGRGRDKAFDVLR